MISKVAKEDQQTKTHHKRIKTTTLIVNPTAMLLKQRVAGAETV